MWYADVPQMQMQQLPILKENYASKTLYCVLELELGEFIEALKRIITPCCTKITQVCPLACCKTIILMMYSTTECNDTGKATSDPVHARIQLLLTRGNVCKQCRPFISQLSYSHKLPPKTSKMAQKSATEEDVRDSIVRE